MPPLGLDDLADLQADLEVLDERDLLTELRPDLGAATGGPAPVLPAPLPLAATSGRSALRAVPVPPVPAAAPRARLRRGPLPAVPDAARPVTTRPPVPGTDVVRMPAVPPVPGVTRSPDAGVRDGVQALPGVRVVLTSLALPAPPAARRRHAAPDGPARGGLAAWAVEPGR